MIEPSFDYFEINISDIWLFESCFYLEEEKNDKHISTLLLKMEDLIIREYLNPSLSSKSKVVPFTDESRYESGEHKEYFKRHVDENRLIKSVEDRVRAGFFIFKNNIFEYHQDILISRSDSSFDYWFALKLRQYNLNSKQMILFLENTLENSFHKNEEDFINFITTIFIDYEKSYFSDKTINYVNNWLEGMKPKTELPEEKPIKKQITRKITSTYRTFYLSVLDRKKTLFEAGSKSNFSFLDIFKKLKHHEFIDSKTNFENFKAIFKESNIEDSNKVIWTGTYYELRFFIDEIDKANICHPFKKVDKWLIAMLCFKKKIKQGTNAEEVINIENYKKLADASPSGDYTNRIVVLSDLVNNLKSQC
jgi:hypothetical protein